MEQTDLAFYQELLDCMGAPAFLLKDGALLLRSAAAAPAEAALRVLMEDELVQPRAEISHDGWDFSVRPFHGALLVLVSRTEKPEDAMTTARFLRAPLSDLFGALSFMFPRLEDLGDPVLMRKAAELNRGLYRLLRTVGNMDLISGEMPTPRKDRLSLNLFLSRLYEEAEPLCRQAGVSLSLKNAPQPISVFAASQALERALLNLLSNAVRFAGTGAKVILRLRRHQKQAMIEVWNHAGPGSHQEAGNSRMGQGAGLGLTVVRKLVQVHGGVFLFRPLEDGACALIALPLDRGSQAVTLRSPALEIDYAGGFNHLLLEFSDVLPSSAFGPESVD